MVSIVIPCYNDGTYLQEVLPFAINQTYRNKEIIIVNDGSTDLFTIEFLKTLNPAICVINQENKGLGAARNIGIQRATGEFILTWDADDFYEQIFIENALQKLNHKNVAAVTSGVKQFGEGFEDVFYPRPGSIKEFLFGNSWPASALFRKSVWQQVGGFDENRTIDSFADWDFWIRIAALGYEFVVLDSVLFNYRVTKKSMYLNELKNSKQMLKYLVNKNEDIYEKYCKDIIISLYSERLDLYQRIREKRNKNIELINEKYSQNILSKVRNMFKK